jgi:hypothetical protein
MVLRRKQECVLRSVHDVAAVLLSCVACSSLSKAQSCVAQARRVYGSEGVEDQKFHQGVLSRLVLNKCTQFAREREH